MARWAGEGKDWVQEVTRHPPKKAEVIIALVDMTGQPTKHLTKKVTDAPSQKNQGVGSCGS